MDEKTEKFSNSKSSALGCCLAFALFFTNFNLALHTKVLLIKVCSFPTAGNQVTIFQEAVTHWKCRKRLHENAIFDTINTILLCTSNNITSKFCKKVDFKAANFCDNKVRKCYWRHTVKKHFDVFLLLNILIFVLQLFDDCIFFFNIFCNR